MTGRSLAGICAVVLLWFPGAESDATLHATILTAAPGEYEVNLGFTPECGGGNACSYGNLVGKRVTAGPLRGTRNFPYALKDAAGIRLARSVQGYFIPSRCGANCDDAKVFWIADGVQYMVDACRPQVVFQTFAGASQRRGEEDDLSRHAVRPSSSP